MGTTEDVHRFGRDETGFGIFEGLSPFFGPGSTATVLPGPKNPHLPLSLAHADGRAARRRREAPHQVGGFGGGGNEEVGDLCSALSTSCRKGVLHCDGSVEDALVHGDERVSPTPLDEHRSLREHLRPRPARPAGGRAEQDANCVEPAVVDVDAAPRHLADLLFLASWSMATSSRRTLSPESCSVRNPILSASWLPFASLATTSNP